MVNTVTLAIESPYAWWARDDEGNPGKGAQGVFDFIAVFDIVAMILFSIECGLKLAAYGQWYFQSRWNQMVHYVTASKLQSIKGVSTSGVV